MHRILDSDSDVDDLVHVVSTSNSQLSISFSTFSKLMLSPRWEPSQCVSRGRVLKQKKFTESRADGGIFC